MTMVFGKKQQQQSKPIEEELADLQRKFRTLEIDKRSCSEDNQATIRKQRAAIEKLTRENRKMKGELNDTRMSTGPHTEAKMTIETLQKLKQQKETLDVKIEQETKNTTTLADNLEATNQSIFAVRGEMAKNGGINASLDNAKAVQKQIRILENRLDKGLQKFNESIHTNKHLREDIDTLRRERVVFDDIYQKLQSELQQKKREMANIIEQSNAAYEARDQAQAQMAALKQQADREHAEFEREWRELGKLIQNDKKMKEFMRGQTRDAKALMDQTQQPKEGTTQKKTARQAWDASASMTSFSTDQADREKVTSHEEAFARIQAATGLDDLDKLVQKFIDAEDQNFTAFKYNTELTADIEKLEQQIEDYNQEYVQLSGTSNKREDTEKVKILEALDEQFHGVDKKAMHYEVKCQETQTTLKNVGDVIKSTFKRLGCQPSDLPSGVGPISECNLLQYLGVIEESTNDALRIWESMNEDEDSAFETTRPAARPGASTQLQINKLPSTVEDYSDDEDEDEDEDSRPFTIEELKARTRQKTKKVAAKSRARGRG